MCFSIISISFNILFPICSSLLYIAFLFRTSFFFIATPTRLFSSPSHDFLPSLLRYLIIVIIVITYLSLFLSASIPLSLSLSFSVSLSLPLSLSLSFSFSLQIYINVDPLSLAGQRAASLIPLIRSKLHLHVTLILTPMLSTSIFPLQNFFRSVFFPLDVEKYVLTV